MLIFASYRLLMMERGKCIGFKKIQSMNIFCIFARLYRFIRE